MNITSDSLTTLDSVVHELIKEIIPPQKTIFCVFFYVFKFCIIYIFY